MYHPLFLQIGLRYTRAKRRNFVSFITFISAGGMALGITTLIVVLSVMNGFQQEIRERLLGMSAHVSAFSIEEGGIADWHQLSQQIVQTEPQVQGVAPFIDAQALISNGSITSPASIQGISPAEEVNVTRISEFMLDEIPVTALQPGEFGIILGNRLSSALRVGVGDKVSVVISQASVTPIGLIPRMKRFTVIGLFSANAYEYDRNLALIALADAATLAKLPEGHVSGVRMKVSNVFQSPQIATQLDLQLNPDGYYRNFFIQDWTQANASFFRAVQMEKTMMFIILTLIVLVATFNIISMLVMVVTDKQSDIAILRTLGLSPRQVMGIFMVQGIAIGFSGTLLGVICGTLLATNLSSVVAWLERVLQHSFVVPEVYFISDLPSVVQTQDILTISITAFLISTLMTLYPAWRAARTQPAEALRYE